MMTGKTKTPGGLFFFFSDVLCREKENVVEAIVLFGVVRLNLESMFKNMRMRFDLVYNVYFSPDENFAV